MTSTPETLRKRIMQLVREYYNTAFSARSFIPGEIPVPYAGRVFDDEEIVNIETTGRKIDIRAEVDLSQPLGIATWQRGGAVCNFKIKPIQNLVWRLREMI